LIGGTSFVTAINMQSTAPGPGIFTQNGGTVIPAIAWGNQVCLAVTTPVVSTIGTGTYNLVNGTLIVSNTLYFGRNGGVVDGHYGIFNQSGGTADVVLLGGAWGEVNLTGGIFKLGSVMGNVGTGVTLHLGGGRLAPKTTAWVTIPSPTVFTGANGNMTFAPEAGRTVRLSGISTGPGGFVKEGAGALYLSNTNAFVGTADIQAGTCTVAVAGCLTQCTNLLVAADAHLTLQRNGAALNTNLWLKVAADGKVHLDYTGEVSVSRLVLGGHDCPGRGRRYGSAAHTSAIDVVKGDFLTGTGVLVVVGPQGPEGTVISLK
jgi:autotransporter-associated beta strand protein